MRLAVWVCLVLFVLAAAPREALARAPKGDDFQLVPTAKDMLLFYPAEAMRDDRDGHVALCCRAKRDGTLSCRSAWHGPAEYAFDEAALAVSKRFKLKPEAAAAARAAPPFLLPIRFRFKGGRPPNEPERPPEITCAKQR